MMTYKIGAPWSELRVLFRYPNELMKCSCFPDLLSLGLFPDMKELTESAAAYAALRKLKVFDLGDPGVALISIADGCTPRTAAMFAFRTAWQCISIDPRLKKLGWDVKRLTCWALRVEDCVPQHYDKLAIVAVHGHAPLDVVCEKFTADERVVVAIPCCVPQVRERRPDIRYIDKGVWSPKNEILIWKDPKEGGDHARAYQSEM